MSPKLQTALLVFAAGVALAAVLVLRPSSDAPGPALAVVTFPPLADGEGAILFAGDTLLALSARKVMSAQGPAAPLEGLSTVFRGSSAAAVVLNQEGPITTRRGTPGPNGKKKGYSARPATAQTLAAAGVTHASLANNHALDQGLEGLRDSAAHLRDAGVVPFGWGEDVNAAMEPAVVNVAGTKVAIIGLLHPWPKYWKAGWAATEERAGLLMLRKPRVEEAVGRARALADVVVLFGHTGREYQPLHSSQRTEADWAVAAGSDALVGHHSHVAQGWSMHEGMPVIWGLGNAAFGSNGRFGDEAGYGLLARMVIAEGRIDRFELMLIETNNEVTGYRSRPAPGDVARRVLTELALQGPTELELVGDIAVLRVPQTPQR